jgi:hypothetical protein
MQVWRAIFQNLEQKINYRRSSPEYIYSEKIQNLIKRKNRIWKRTEI